MAGLGPDPHPAQAVVQDSGGRGAFVIFNPASDGGRGEKRIARYLDLMKRHLPDFRHGVSPRGGGEADLTDEALRQGFTTLVAVGGDGTWSAVADRILASGRRDLTLGILPSGTGNDFGRNLGLPRDDPEAAVRILARGHVRRVDAGRLSGASRHEERSEEPREHRHFLNVVGFGFDVGVVDEAKGARILRGELLYRAAALKQLFRFRGFEVTLEDGEGYRLSRQTLMLTITNGSYFGGGFPMAPGASPDDGALHACSIGDAKPFRRLVLFDRVGRGRHEDAPEVRSHAASRFRLTFRRAPRFEIDGDLYAAQDTALALEVLPGALRVLAPEE